MSGHPFVEFGVAARYQRRAVREADVLLGAGAQAVLAIRPAAMACQFAATPVRSTATTSGTSTPMSRSSAALAATASALAPAPTTARVGAHETISRSESCHIDCKRSDVRCGQDVGQGAPLRASTGVVALGEDRRQLMVSS